LTQRISAPDVWVFDHMHATTDGFDCFCSFQGSKCRNWTVGQTCHTIYTATFATSGNERRCCGHICVEHICEGDATCRAIAFLLDKVYDVYGPLLPQTP